jgi:hypothetical protein
VGLKLEAGRTFFNPESERATGEQRETNIAKRQSTGKPSLIISL